MKRDRALGGTNLLTRGAVRGLVVTCPTQPILLKEALCQSSYFQMVGNFENVCNCFDNFKI